MGSSSSEAGDEDRISDCVGSHSDVVVIDLADAGRTTLAHKRKRARGEFPWAHTHGWMEGDPLAQKGEVPMRPLQEMVLEQDKLLWLEGPSL